MPTATTPKTTSPSLEIVDECQSNAESGVQKTLALIGAKWTIRIIWTLCSEPKGFNQIEREIPGISPRILSERMKELVSNGLVHKTVFPTTPPTVQYQLTTRALELRPILRSLDKWGQA